MSVFRIRLDGNKKA
ncbi:hypothetical protein [Escherichia coli]